MKSLRLLLLSVGIVAFCTLLINPVLGSKARILAGDELRLTRGGCWKCSYGSCVGTTECFPTGDGKWAQKIGQGGSFAGCTPWGGIWDDCELIDIQHCFDVYYDCDDGSCSSGCEWSPDYRPSECDLT